MISRPEVAEPESLARPSSYLGALPEDLDPSRDIHSRMGLAGHFGLSSRELEVLQYSAEGRTAYEIARLLFLSQETVHSHVKNAVQKLRVSNKTAAVVRALRLGLID